MSYRVRLRASAEKQLAKLNAPEFDSINAQLLALAENPRPAACRKLHGLEGWRIRVGRYRVVYEIDDTSKTVMVLRVAHRKDVYR